ncbi:MAG: adenine deaminase [Desulfosarcina sp.]|nr:adenine deaminase [Desulfobacterales bacterium]
MGDPVTAIRIATLNPANYFNLRTAGAIAPGKRADLVILNDLETVAIDQVYAGGRLAAEAGTVAADLTWPEIVAAPPSMHIDPESIDLRLKAEGPRVRVIEIVRNQIITTAGVARAAIHKGLAVSDPTRDLLKIAVIERHRGTGRTGIGFVRGMGIAKGALASSVAHDAHNIVVVGADDNDMLTAVGKVVEMGGGLTAAAEGRILASLALPIAGLMSPRPIDAINNRMRALLAAARRLGASLPDPFMTLSFLALPVIPSLKITDHGLVDVDRFAVVPLFDPATDDDING